MMERIIEDKGSRKFYADLVRCVVGLCMGLVRGQTNNRSDSNFLVVGLAMHNACAKTNNGYNLKFQVLIFNVNNCNLNILFQVSKVYFF